MYHLQKRCCTLINANSQQPYKVHMTIPNVYIGNRLSSPIVTTSEAMRGILNSMSYFDIQYQ